jgi:N-acetyl-anhydromuramyl-L-alanine amidase AmpD
MRAIRKIILHCSASDFGDVDVIRGWHLERGFADIGYHYVILNGKRFAGYTYSDKIDGIVEIGRPIQARGAHCAGNNYDSIGICMIGDKIFTEKQIKAVLLLISGLRERFGNIPVYGHYEMPSGIKQGKTCPNIDMDKFRKENDL